jgi:hypothetical protein
VKFDGAQDRENDEQQQALELCEFERRLGIRGRKGMESGNFLVQLGDQDEAVEVQGDNGGDDVGPAPVSGHGEFVARGIGEGQRNDGVEADDVRRQEVREIKNEMVKALSYGG